MAVCPHQHSRVFLMSVKCVYLWTGGGWAHSPGVLRCWAPCLLIWTVWGLLVKKSNIQYAECGFQAQSVKFSNQIHGRGGIEFWAEINKQHPGAAVVMLKVCEDWMEGSGYGTHTPDYLLHHIPPFQQNWPWWWWRGTFVVLWRPPLYLPAAVFYFLGYCVSVGPLLTDDPSKPILQLMSWVVHELWECYFNGIPLMLFISPLAKKCFLWKVIMVNMLSSHEW